MSYTIEWHEYGAIKKHEGFVSMRELLESLAKVQRRADFKSFRFSITDFSQVQRIEFNETEMLTYGAHVIGGQFANRQLHIGIVTTDPAVIEVLKRRYQPMVKYPVRYFDTLEECKHWVAQEANVVW